MHVHFNDPSHQPKTIVEHLVTRSSQLLPGISSPASHPGLDLASALVRALQPLEHPVFVVEANATIVLASAGAEELVERRRGLTVRAGALSADVPHETQALHRAIMNCARAGSMVGVSSTLVVNCDDPHPLGLTIMPLRDWGGAHPGAAAAVHVADPRRCVLPSTKELQERAGLTRAEAVLAIDIAIGDGLLACAKRLRISHTTARSHLRQIFRKSSTQRQAELLRYLFAMHSGVRLK